jgi:calmodulin
MSDFDDELKEYFRLQFKLFDKDNSDTIPIGDLGSALRMCGLNPWESELQQIVEEADHEGTGIVNFQTFLDSIMTGLTHYHSVEEAKDAFRAFDPEQRGVISMNDLRYVFSTLGDKLTDEEINELVVEAQAESDVDGNVQYDSFIVRMLPDFLK